jgi:hypothetical protein
MKSKWMRRGVASAALTLGALVALGCAEERDPINRVQANALPKSFFVGEDLAGHADDPDFFTHGFVVDQSENQGDFTVGQGPGLERVRFDITESHIIAYRAYQNNDGADDRGLANPDGEIIAAYAIEKHFDIKYAYNSATGEEINVITEDTSDRPWHEREYMRVNWGLTSVVSPVWTDVFFAKTFDGTTRITQESYYVSDPDDENAPHFELDKGYFDVTAKMFVEPQPMTMWGEVYPACLIEGLFTGTAVKTCGPSDAFVRHSFVKIDEVDMDDDFEPFENSRATLDILANIGGNGVAHAVGMYAGPRASWDPGYGYTDENFHRYMYQHNIWKQSHQTVGSCTTDEACVGAIGDGSICLGSGTCSVPCDYGAIGDSDHNGTDDQCENAATGYAGNTGSQCSSRDRCTIPYRDREIRQVAYHVTKETPDELMDTVNAAGELVEVGATEDVMRSWNQLFQHAVGAAREVECRRTGGGSREECHNQFFDGKEMVWFGGWDIDKATVEDDVVVTCHNPVRSYDHEVCGVEGDRARLGDVRKNWLVYWPYSSSARYGGVVKWNQDPLTGMVVGATATTMGRSATRAAAQFRDVILASNQELSWKDITDGVSAARFQRDGEVGYRPTALSVEEMEARIATIANSGVAERVGITAPKGNTFVEQTREHFRQLGKNTTARVGISSPDDVRFQAVANQFVGTDLEAQMITQGRMDDLLGPASIADTRFALERTSPLRLSQLNRVQEQYDMDTAARGRCFMDAGGGVGNADIQGVAGFYGAKFSNDALKENAAYAKLGDEDLLKARAEEIYLALFKDMYKGIMLHEVGHSMGMRHQFASSYDSANYTPQYWQLRTQNGQAMAECDGPRTGDTWDSASDNCMGPRYLDPETDEEMGRGSQSRPGINYFAHTSTMEYQVSRFFESVGLGLYDRMFVGATYGRVLEVFDTDLFSEGEMAAFGARNFSQLVDTNLVYWENLDLQSGAFTQPMHYTKQARRLHLFDAANCRDATAAEQAQATYRLVNNQVCSPVSRDRAAWIDMVDAATSPDYSDLVKKQRVGSDVPTYSANVRWPFRYGENYSNSYLQSNHSDAGADIYEVITQAIRTFEYDYPFRYFRRQQKNWFVESLPSRTAGRFFDRLRSLHWSIANNNARWESLGYMELLGGLDDWWGPYIMAETEMFNALVKTLLMPQADPDGGYAKIPQLGTNGSYYDVYEQSGGFNVVNPEFEVDASTGRFIDPQFNSDPDAGGNWEYIQWGTHTGFAEEKGLVAKALVDGRAVFSTISRDNYLDGRNTSINFRSDLGVALDRIIGGVLSEDWLSVGSYALLDSDDPIGAVSGLPVPKIYATDLSADVVTRPAGAMVLFPNLGYDQQLDLLIFTHIFAKVNTDLDLARKMWIWIDGHIGEFNVPEDQQVRFTDANSGFTYIARMYGDDMIDGRVVDKGIGSRMLQHANLLLEQVYQVERDTDNEIIYNEFGQPQIRYVDGLAVQSASASYDRIAALKAYVGLLDTAVQIENIIGYGPLD